MTFSSQARQLLFVAPPIGPLGSGLGGGVELTMLNVAHELRRRNYLVTVVAPSGSKLSKDIPVVEIPGKLQSTAHTQSRETPVTLPDNAVLANMWHYVQDNQDQADLIVNFAYDWLPLYLTPFFNKPLAHFITMGSLNNVMDTAVSKVAGYETNLLGCYTRTQAKTFPCPEAFHCLGSAIQLEQYQFCANPGPAVAWLGRISPEKGVEDALAATQRAGIPLKIMGKLEDKAYWQRICKAFPHAPETYLGFLSTEQLQAILRECRALIMTPRWVEAFGNVAIEALACGVPVVSYARGGPAEIVINGLTGWLVPSDDVDALTDALQNIDQLDRQACRQQAADTYSLRSLGDRFEAWFKKILAAPQR